MRGACDDLLAIPPPSHDTHHRQATTTTARSEYSYRYRRLPPIPPQMMSEYSYGYGGARTCVRGYASVYVSLLQCLPSHRPPTRTLAGLMPSHDLRTSTYGRRDGNAPHDLHMVCAVIHTWSASRWPSTPGLRESHERKHARTVACGRYSVCAASVLATILTGCSLSYLLLPMPLRRSAASRLLGAKAWDAGVISGAGGHLPTCQTSWVVVGRVQYGRVIGRR